MKLPLYTSGGKSSKQIELSDEIFAAPINPTVMHQALLRQLANARRGTHKTKTRAEVAGSTAKVWRQKGTGRARQGSTKAPQWKGGGVVFGPRPEENYRQTMTKKMRHLALRGALTSKAQEARLLIVDELRLQEPKTKEMAALLEKLRVDGKSLILLPQREEMIERAARNLAQVKILLAQYLNLQDILGHDWLVIPQASLPIIESTLSEGQIGKAGEPAAEVKATTAKKKKAKAKPAAGGD